MGEKLAIVTGASTGAGFALAHLAADNGYDLIIAADEPLIDATGKDLRAKGITLTTLMPGATATQFFARANMLDTEMGQDPDRADPAKVARDGWEALMACKGHIVSGWKNKAQVAAGGVMPQSVLADQHRRMAEPGSVKT